MLVMQVLDWDRHKNVADVNKPIKEIPTLPLLIIGSLTTIKMQTYNENTVHIHFHSKSLHTMTKMNDNIYMVDFDLIFGV